MSQSITCFTPPWGISLDSVTILERKLY